MDIRITGAQRRVLRGLGGGVTSEPGAGCSIHINGVRVCNVDTLFALQRRGLVEQVVRGGLKQVGQWRATEAGVALARQLWPE